MSDSQRILCIDFGLKRIGLALSDDSGAFAAPYAVRQRVNIKRDIADLVETVRGLRVHTVVFGLPRVAETRDGQPQAPQVHHQEPLQHFAGKLEQALQKAGCACEIVWWDERFSTAQAWRGLRDSGVSARRGKEIIDAHAASVILQDYLDAGRKNTHSLTLNHDDENQSPSAPPPSEDDSWLK